MPAGGLVTLGIGTAAAGLFGSLGAKKQADSSVQAAQIQAASGDKAAALVNQLGNRSLDFQQSQWQQAQENMRPFLGLGRGAAEMLGTAMGITPDYPPQTSMPTASSAAPKTMGGMYGQGTADPRILGAAGATPQILAAGGVSGLNLKQVDPRTLAAAGATPRTLQAQGEKGGDAGQTTGGSAANQSGYANTSSYGATVRVRWPSGQEQDVPSYQAKQYEDLGAEVTT